MPLFAFVNAGIFMNKEILSQAFHTSITWGVILGLFIGKPLGILISIYILLTFFYKEMPTSKTIWKMLFGVSLLCGIGFTMSLFIANLSFNDEMLLQDAKIGILIASLISGFLGYFLLYQSTKKSEDVNTSTMGFGKNSKDKKIDASTNSDA
jgi:NhaA family Na+:H+ antiporter